MTVDDIYEPSSTLGNGITTAFSFDHNVESSSEVVVNSVTLSNNVKSLQTEGDEYTIALNTSTEGGTANFGIAPVSGIRILTERNTTFDQQNNIPSVGDIREEKIENPDDKLTRLAQQLREITIRCAKLNVEDSTKFPSFNYDLPQPLSGINQILTLHSAGFSGITLGALSAIGLPTTSGLVKYTGANAFQNIELSALGTLTITNPKAQGGNPLFSVSAIDNKIVNLSASIVALSASTLDTPKSMSLTRLDSATTNSQTVAHGFTGKQPTQFTCVSYNPTGNASGGLGYCYTDGSTFVQACQSDEDSGAGGQNIQKDFFAQVMTVTETNGQRLSITGVNASAVTFLFTKVGTPTAGTYEFEIGMR